MSKPQLFFLSSQPNLLRANTALRKSPLSLSLSLNVTLARLLVFLIPLGSVTNRKHRHLNERENVCHLGCPVSPPPPYSFLFFSIEQARSGAN